MTQVTLKDYAKYQLVCEKKDRNTLNDTLKRLIGETRANMYTDLTSKISTHKQMLEDLITMTNKQLQMELHDFMAIDPIP